jgi:hypothetical protein
MALDPEKKAELVERLKLARQKKVEMKKLKANTEEKQPLLEKADEYQGLSLAPEPKPEPKPQQLKPLPEPVINKENLTESRSKDKAKNKFMKVVYYSEPPPKILKKMASIFSNNEDSESESEPTELPPKLRTKAKANPPKTTAPKQAKIKPQPTPSEPDPAEERRAYLKQLANMYF